MGFYLLLLVFNIYEDRIFIFTTKVKVDEGKYRGVFFYCKTFSKL